MYNSTIYYWDENEKTELFSENVKNNIFNIVGKEDGTLNQSLVFDVFPNSPFYNKITPSVKKKIYIEHEFEFYNDIYMIVQTIKRLDGIKTVYCYSNSYIEDCAIRGGGGNPDKTPFRSNYSADAIVAIGNLLEMCNEYLANNFYANYFIRDVSTRLSSDGLSEYGKMSFDNPSDYVGKNLLEYINRIIADNNFYVIGKCYQDKGIGYIIGTFGDFMRFMDGDYDVGGLFLKEYRKTFSIDDVSAITEYEEECNIKNVYTRSLVYKTPDGTLSKGNSINYTRWANNSALRSKYGVRIKTTNMENATTTALSKQATKLANEMKDTFRTIKFSFSPALVEKKYFGETQMIKLLDKIVIDTDIIKGTYIVTGLERCYDNPSKSKFFVKGV